MANPTTNYGWVMPTATDLVTDLPADFAVFGQAVDTSLVDLLGGTTGQVLAKASNTNMDFVWTAGGDIEGVTAGTGISGGGTSGTVTITNTMATAIDAKGDLVAGTGADAFARLAVGTNGYVLSANSAQATGLEWIAASGAPAIKQIVTNTTSTSSSTTSGSMVDMSNLTATITPSSVSSKILAFIYVGGYITQSTTATKTAMAEMSLVRTATTVYNQRFGVEDGFNATNAKYVYYRHTAMYLDSPATTSATTYKCQASVATATQVDWNNPRLVLMEV